MSATTVQTAPPMDKQTTVGNYFVSNYPPFSFWKPELAGEVIAATFPGGTITGCPKLRCMEIIAELETEARGAYTGSLGYLNLDGSGDFNILIRTMTLHGREIRFRAGAGIVADSDPTRELHETRAKARGMLLALGQQGHNS